MKPIFILLFMYFINVYEMCGGRTHMESGERSTYFYQNQIYKKLILENKETFQAGVINK
jgi:hypothetical protein